MTLAVEAAPVGEQVAFVFPGQGSQYVGMGQRLHDLSDAARRVFQQADDILGFHISRLCFHGPSEELGDTINAQPAILAVSHATHAALQERWNATGVTPVPICYAGHSMGEFSALVAAGTLDFGDALRLVRERGRLMKEAGDVVPGGMAAVVGMDRDQLTALCAAASAQGGIVVLANDNCPGQSVISGDVETLLRAMRMAHDQGARMVRRLDISIASHSPLMFDASQQLGDAAEGLRFSEPLSPIVSNITGKFVTSVDDLRRNVGVHMVRPVQWTSSVLEMVDHGVGTFLEVGPGQVLGGLIRRVRREVKTLTAADYGVQISNPR